MPVTLSAAAVTTMDANEAVNALLYEFLGKYFDGQTHEVGGLECDFPKATIEIGQGGNGEMSVPEIRIITQSSKSEEYANGEGRVVHEHMQLALGVRVANGQDAKAVAGRVSDRIYGLLRSQVETHVLAQKGIYELQVRLPKPVGDDDFQRFLIMGRFKLILES